MSARFAVYLCPDPSGAAWAAGSDWLARCAATGMQRRQPAIPGLAPQLMSALTAAPRRYGFHATMKAPFRLAQGATRARFRRALEEFTSRRRAFDGPPLEVRLLDGFLALTPEYRDARLDALAARCVAEFDRFRAPLSAGEIAQREKAGLTTGQRAMLRRWGYPYVMDEFRAHYTLTGSLSPYDEGVVERVAEFANRHFEGVRRALRNIDTLALFEEPAPGADLCLLERARLQAPGRLLYVVGPSGAGKDSVIAWARKHLPAPYRVHFARRTITRAAGHDSEDHQWVDAATFEMMRNAGQFALSWEAHGWRYGIGHEMLAALDQGRTVVVNGSREHLPEVLRRHPTAQVVHIVASESTLRERLSARGREEGFEIEGRLGRPALAASPETPVVEIVNEGPIEQAGRQLLAHIATEGAARR
jgi:phosphonate metabolism protein PhnN/1,5-bisphosphokinase (PRPP-forming)